MAFQISCTQEMHVKFHLRILRSLENLRLTPPFLCTGNVCEISSVLYIRNIHEILSVLLMYRTSNLQKIVPYAELKFSVIRKCT